MTFFVKYLIGRNMFLEIERTPIKINVNQRIFAPLGTNDLINLKLLDEWKNTIIYHETMKNNFKNIYQKHLNIYKGYEVLLYHQTLFKYINGYMNVKNITLDYILIGTYLNKDKDNIAKKQLDKASIFKKINRTFLFYNKNVVFKVFHI